MNSDFSSDVPATFGPITWDVGQTLAIKATTKSKAEHMINITWRDIVEAIRCHHCHDDAINYLNTHPFVWKDEKSAFRYIYDMHQWVNGKLGKPGISFDAAYNKYINRPNLPCSAACQESDPKNIHLTSNITSQSTSTQRNDNTLPKLTLINLTNGYPTNTTNSKVSSNKVPIKFGRIN